MTEYVKVDKEEYEHLQDIETLLDIGILRCKDYLTTDTVMMHVNSCTLEVLEYIKKGRK